MPVRILLKAKDGTNEQEWEIVRYIPDRPNWLQDQIKDLNHAPDGVFKIVEVLNTFYVERPKLSIVKLRPSQK